MGGKVGIGGMKGGVGRLSSIFFFPCQYLCSVLFRNILIPCPSNIADLFPRALAHCGQNGPYIRDWVPIFGVLAKMHANMCIVHVIF